MVSSHTLFISAIEPSANIHLKALAQEMDSITKQQHITLEIVGIFDNDVFSGCSNIQAHSSYDLRAFSAMAFIDVIKKVFFYKRVNLEMIALAKTCQKALLIDSSSFHIPLAKGLKGSGVEVVYYILPQVWAWKSWRAKEIERICNRLCAILPFELSMYPNAVQQNRAQYVGHPLLDELPIDSPLPRTQEIVFMPGSRQGEIKKIFPIFAQVAKQLHEPKILVAPSHFATLPKEELQNIYGEEIKEFTLSFDATKALQTCKFAFICSGTATLQAALLQAPFVLAYTMRPIEYHIVKFFVKLKVVGLANILYQGACNQQAGKSDQKLHTELIQDDLTPQNLLDSYHNFDCATYIKNAQTLRAYLQHGSSHNVARILLTNLTHLR